MRKHIIIEVGQAVSDDNLPLAFKVPLDMNFEISQNVFLPHGLFIGESDKFNQLGTELWLKGVLDNLYILLFVVGDSGHG